MMGSLSDDDVALVLRTPLEFVFAEMLGLLGMLPVVWVHLFGRHHHVVEVSCIV